MPRLGLFGSLLIAWACLLWNAFLAAQLHEPLRRMSFPVSGLPGLVQPPPQDRFLLDDPDSHYWLANVRRMLLEGRWPAGSPGCLAYCWSLP
jgi:hypothetical protein